MDTLNYVLNNMNDCWPSIREALNRSRTASNTSKLPISIQKIASACAGNFTALLTYNSKSKLHAPLLALAFIDKTRSDLFQEGLLEALEGDVADLKISVLINRNYNTLTHKTNIRILYSKYIDNDQTIIDGLELLSDNISADKFTSQNEWISSCRKHGHSHFSPLHIDDLLANNIEVSVPFREIQIN